MLNLDTHILIFLLTDELTKSETETLKGKAAGISSIVLWEIAKLHQLGRIPFGIRDPRVREVLDKLHVWDIDAEVAAVSATLDFRSDPADEIIAATSIVTGAPLLTRDLRILTSKLVPLAR